MKYVVSLIFAVFMGAAVAEENPQFRMIFDDGVDRAVCIAEVVSFDTTVEDPRPEMPVLINCVEPIWARVGGEWNLLNTMQPQE